MNEFSYIEKNLREVEKEIELAKGIHGQDVTLVAVTKSGSDEELLALAECGIKNIGENRPQEAKRRYDLLKSAGFDINMHEIGNLQRNKVKLILNCACLIHSVDSFRLAKEIDKQAKAVSKTVPILLEVNSGREESKEGVFPEDLEKRFLEVRELKNIAICGLMTMGPVCENEEDIRPYFKLTKKLFDEIKNKYGFSGSGVLSMGMSNSYRIAIEEGSTLVRVGRRLFERK